MKDSVSDQFPGQFGLIKGHVGDLKTNNELAIEIQELRQVFIQLLRSIRPAPMEGVAWHLDASLQKLMAHPLIPEEQL